MTKPVFRKLNKAVAYNTHSGAYVLTTKNPGPIEVVIEVHAEEKLALAYAKRIVQCFNRRS